MKYNGITGISTGLGSYLLSATKSIAIKRHNVGGLFDDYGSFETIIHRAFERFTSEKSDGYVERNLELTKSLLKLPARRFIFTLNEIASNFNSVPKFGAFQYETQLVSNGCTHQHVPNVLSKYSDFISEEKRFNEH